MNDILGWRFDGALRPSDEAFSRYIASLEEWSQHHTECGWLDTPPGSDHVEFLDWFERTFE